VDFILKHEVEHLLHFVEPDANPVNIQFKK